MMAVLGKGENPLVPWRSRHGSLLPGALVPPFIGGAFVDWSRKRLSLFPDLIGNRARQQSGKSFHRMNTRKRQRPL